MFAMFDAQTNLYPRRIAVQWRNDEGRLARVETMTDDSGARPSRPLCYFAGDVAPEEQAYLEGVLSCYMRSDETSWCIRTEAGWLYAGKPTWYTNGYWELSAEALVSSIIVCYYCYR